MKPIVGSIVALVTPMHQDGSVDYDGLRRLIDWHITEGTDCIGVVGTTGESPTVSVEEHCEIIRTAVEHAAGRVPIMAGAGANSTAEAIELSRFAKSVGADCTLSVVPYYNKPSQEGLYQHFKAIAEGTQLPIVLYNVPGRTSVNMSAETTLRLSELRNIVAIKEYADLPQMSTIIAGAREDFLVLSGDDPVTVAVMAIGGRGVISVASNEAPSEMAQIVELCEKGDYALARKLHHWLFPLIQVNFVESNPIPCKAAMAAMGLIEESYRLPLVPPTPAARDKIMGVLQQLKMLGAAARV